MDESLLHVRLAGRDAAKKSKQAINTPLWNGGHLEPRSRVTPPLHAEDKTKPGHDAVLLVSRYIDAAPRELGSSVSSKVACTPGGSSSGACPPSTYHCKHCLC